MEGIHTYLGMSPVSRESDMTKSRHWYPQITHNIYFYAEEQYLQYHTNLTYYTIYMIKTRLIGACTYLGICVKLNNINEAFSSMSSVVRESIQKISTNILMVL